jgi:hypothetical protein
MWLAPTKIAKAKIDIKKTRSPQFRFVAALIA